MLGNPRKTSYGRKVLSNEKIMSLTVATIFVCNSSVQCMHFAWTNQPLGPGSK